MLIFTRKFLALLVLLGTSLLISCAQAEVPRTPAEFHRAVYVLAQQVLGQYSTRSVEESGEYAGSAAAHYRFVDTRYYEQASGRLLAHIRRDAEKPDAVHIIEVNIYDAQGNLVRDFGSISLPWAPQIAERTMINLHHHNGELHSFRQYDMYGDPSYAACSGRWQGRPLRLDIDSTDSAEQANSAAYRACFDGFNPDPHEFLAPH